MPKGHHWLRKLFHGNKLDKTPHKFKVDSRHHNGAVTHSGTKTWKFIKPGSAKFPHFKKLIKDAGSIFIKYGEADEKKNLSIKLKPQEVKHSSSVFPKFNIYSKKVHKLTKQTVEELKHFIDKTKNVIKLEIRGVEITQESADSLASLLKGMKQIKHVGLLGCKFDSKVAAKLTESIKDPHFVTSAISDMDHTYDLIGCSHHKAHHTPHDFSSF